MRFRIAPSPTIYDVDSIEKLTLRDTLQLQRMTAAEGVEISPALLQEMTETLGKMTAAERGRSQEALWIVAVTIFVARRRAGEEISFVDAIDFPIVDLDWLPDPQDHQKPADPTQARRASARAGKSQRKPAKTTPTSKAPSPAASS